MSREVKVVCAVLMATIVMLGVGIGVDIAVHRSSPTAPATPVAVTSPVTVDPTSQDNLVIQAAWDQISQSDRDGVCQLFNIDQDTAMQTILSGITDPPSTETLRTFLEGEC